MELSSIVFQPAGFVTTDALARLGEHGCLLQKCRFGSRILIPLGERNTVTEIVALFLELRIDGHIVEIVATRSIECALADKADALWEYLRVPPPKYYKEAQIHDAPGRSTWLDTDGLTLTMRLTRPSGSMQSACDDAIKYTEEWTNHVYDAAIAVGIIAIQ